jgi:hypothetical protein
MPDDAEQITIAEGDYLGTIHHLCDELQSLLITHLKDIEMTSSERSTIYFDVLWCFLMNSIMRYGVSREHTHEIVDWFFDHQALVPLGLGDSETN